MHRTGRVKKFVPILPYSGLILHIWLCGEKHLQSFFSSRGLHNFILDIGKVAL